MPTLLQQLMASGKVEVFILELIEAIMGSVGCSRRTAYRLLRQALDEGTVRFDA